MCFCCILICCCLFPFCMNFFLHMELSDHWSVHIPNDFQIIKYKGPAANRPFPARLNFSIKSCKWCPSYYVFLYTLPLVNWQCLHINTFPVAFSSQDALNFIECLLDHIFTCTFWGTTSLYCKSRSMYCINQRMYTKYQVKLEKLLTCTAESELPEELLASQIHWEHSLRV